DLEFGLGKTPPAGTVTAEATLRTAPAPAPTAEVIPFPAVTRPVSPSEPTRRVTPVEDLDSTWIARPMRLDPVSAKKAAKAAPAAAPSRGRGVWIAAAGVTLVLAAGGLWWALHPAPAPLPSAPPPVVSSTVAPAKAPVASPPPVSPPVETAKVSSPAAP